MSHPKGSITYFPSARFSLNRSYVSELSFHLESHLTYTWAGNEITFLYSPIPTYRAYLKFRDEFVAYSSNTYTLDFIVEWNYETYYTGGPEGTFYLQLGYKYNPVTKRHGIDLTTVSPSLNSTLLLPSPTSPAWWGHE